MPMCMWVRDRDGNSQRIAREQKLLYPGNDLATPTTTAAPAAAKEIALRQWQQFVANISFKTKLSVYEYVCQLLQQQQMRLIKSKSVTIVIV